MQYWYVVSLLNNNAKLIKSLNTTAVILYIHQYFKKFLVIKKAALCIMLVLPAAWPASRWMDGIVMLYVVSI